MFRFFFVSLLIISIVAQDVEFYKVNETATLYLPQSPTYRRKIYVPEEQIFRVCNGKNAKTCGYWENLKTKEKRPSGTTTYNTNKKALVIQKLKKGDFGVYKTGDKKQSQEIYQY